MEASENAGGVKKKILVAEDEKAIGHALELKLQHEGYEVTMAANGEDALAAIKNNTFDIILCDLVMPKKDGFDVLQGVKEAGVSTPVVVLSNLSQEEDAKKAIDLGAKDFFVKSNTPLSEIVKYVKNTLG